MRALSSGSSGGNGVYSYGGDIFPASTYGATNYWVDPILSTSSAPAGPSVLSTTPTAGATNVVWVWSPNHVSVPNTTWNAAANYYPGDGYVDWVGIDGYNRDRTHWHSFATIFSPLYAQFASRKPIMIGETASVEGTSATQKARWIAEARRAMKTKFPAIGAFVWFDTTKQGFDWRFDSSAPSRAAFRALGADPYFRTR